MWVVHGDGRVVAVVERDTCRERAEMVRVRSPHPRYRKWNVKPSSEWMLRVDSIGPTSLGRKYTSKYVYSPGRTNSD